MYLQSFGAFVRRLVVVVLPAFGMVALKPPDVLAYDFTRLYAVPSNDEKPRVETFNLPLTDRIVLGTARYVHIVIAYKEVSRRGERVKITCTRYLPDGTPAMRIADVRDPRIGRSKVQVPDQVTHEVDLAPAGGTTGRLAGFGPYDPGYPLGNYAIECVADGAKVRGTYRLDTMTFEELKAIGQRSVGLIGFHGQPETKPTASPDCKRRPVGAMGTGFVIDTLGHMVTNHHVVAHCREDWPSSRLYVDFADGSRHNAELVADDLLSDVAVIRLATRTIPPLSWVPLPPRDGEDAVAIGFPFSGALRGDVTMTRGIVSGIARAFGRRADLVQTDAAVNPGNSGGPLLNRYGQVIGVNTSILTPGSGGSAGVNFAVSARIAKVVSDQIIRSGRVRRARLGVNETFLLGLVWEDVKAFSRTGLVVQTVAPGSAAARSGIQPCDIIERLDWNPVSDSRLVGQSANAMFAPIDSPGDLFNALLHIASGTDVAISLRRPRPTDCFDRGFAFGDLRATAKVVEAIALATPMRVTVKLE